MEAVVVPDGQTVEDVLFRAHLAPGDPKVIPCLKNNMKPCVSSHSGARSAPGIFKILYENY